ncbi:MAG: hypothetical protein KDA05_04180 [Phycisphaerales bacterium]|nr:hypothetical protein [Phycisphaerales bacterium]
MPPPRRPALSPTSGSSTRHRLVVYLMGVAIGCLLLGWFTLRRSNEAAMREWQRSAGEQGEAGGQAGAADPPAGAGASDATPVDSEPARRP